MPSSRGTASLQKSPRKPAISYRRQSTPKPLDVAVDERRGTVFAVGHWSGLVAELKATGGALLRSVAVGLVQAAIIVDEAGGRTYVSNNGGHTLSVL